MKRVSVLTKRLHIRPFKVSDYAAWFDSYTNSDPKKSAYDHDPKPAKKCSRREFNKVLTKYKKGAESDGTYVWGVFHRRSGELIGILDISILVRRSIQKANLGYRVFNKHWQQGYASEYVGAGIKMGLKTLKLNRLEAVIDPANRASLRLARKVGMAREGVRQKYYYQKGKWADQVVYSVHREMLGMAALRLK